MTPGGEGERVGFVSLVGAGPGDPGLLTVKGRRALERADVVLYDYLASPALLASVEVPGQERIHVGKTAGAGLSRQEDINALLVRRALAGARVVRLKGGDPFVLGRGGEEAEACVAAGVPFEVVPGVSSVAAVPAYAGIPLTHRDVASGFTVVTGHERTEGEGAARVDWRRVAGDGGTLVVLMGVLQAERWSQELMAGGWAAETPVAFIRWGTTPRQRTLVTTLGAAPGDLAAAGLRPPALAVVGEVVRLRERLAWFEARPLSGQVVGLTRSGGRDERVAERLEALGATVLHVPLTTQRPLDEGHALAEELIASEFTDVVVTSANGVRALAQALEVVGRDARIFAGAKLWAVGPATARALRAEVGLRADKVPREATGEALVELARRVGVTGQRFLFPAAAAARDVVPGGLRSLGAEVVQVTAYETVADPLGPARLETALDAGLTLLAVASPSAVDALVDAMAAAGVEAARVPVAAIGPTTAAHAEARGLTVAVVPDEFTMAGLADAIVAALAGRS